MEFTLEKEQFCQLPWISDLLPITFLYPQEEIEEDSDLSDYGEDVDGRKDALAEPCFMLIGEIFELRGSKPLGYYLVFWFFFFFWLSGYTHTHIHTYNIPLFLSQTCIYIHSFSKYFEGPSRYYGRIWGYNPKTGIISVLMDLRVLIYLASCPSEYRKVECFEFIFFVI